MATRNQPAGKHHCPTLHFHQHMVPAASELRLIWQLQQLTPTNTGLWLCCTFAPWLLLQTLNLTVPQQCSLTIFGVFPIIPYPMQQKQRLIKHLRNSLTTCMLELSCLWEFADRTAGTRVSQNCTHCPGDPAGLCCFPCASASLLWDTAVCPNLDPLMENEKHESFVYLNKSLWPLMRGHSFELRATVFSEADTLRKASTDTRDFGVAACSPMNVSVCSHTVAVPFTQQEHKLRETLEVFSAQSKTDSAAQQSWQMLIFTAFDRPTRTDMLCSDKTSARPGICNSPLLYFHLKINLITSCPIYHRHREQTFPFHFTADFSVYINYHCISSPSLLYPKRKITGPYGSYFLEVLITPRNLRYAHYLSAPTSPMYRSWRICQTWVPATTGKWDT